MNKTRLPLPEQTSHLSCIEILVRVFWVMGEPDRLASKLATCVLGIDRELRR